MHTVEKQPLGRDHQTLTNDDAHDPERGATAVRPCATQRDVRRAGGVRSECRALPPHAADRPPGDERETLIASSRAKSGRAPV